MPRSVLLLKSRLTKPSNADSYSPSSVMLDFPVRCSTGRSCSRVYWNLPFFEISLTLSHLLAFDFI